MIGVAALSVVVLTARVYSDCKSAASAVQTKFGKDIALPDGSRTVEDSTTAVEIVPESGAAREVRVEVVGNPLDSSRGRLQACISTWTQHTCPDSGDTYFYSDPDLGGTGETAWHLPN